MSATVTWRKAASYVGRGAWCRAPVFRGQGPFGGPFARFPHQQGQEGQGPASQGGNPLLGLVTALPIIAILVISLLSSSSEPVSPAGL